MKRRDAARMFGRLMALEMMSTNFLTMTLGGGTPDPIAALADLRERMFNGALESNGPVGGFDEACWQEAIAALEHLFDNTRERLLGLGFET